jgi:hypothetical protein
MKRKLAFVIGAAKYVNLRKLECCAADANAISMLLEKSGKEYEIVNLIDPTAAQIKDAVRDRLTPAGEVSEVFFYFSGHGINGESDLVLCPIDFDSAQENRTGFSRSFLLDALRDAKIPQVAIVIDACESGRTLIKRQGRAAEERQPLDRFIQFSSSLDDQYSLAGESLSAYTKVFVEACLSKVAGPVYYSDIEEYIRDAFSTNLEQTPFFIRQGTSLERFADDAAALQDISVAIRATFFAGPQNVKLPAKVSRTELLAKISANRASRDLVQNFLDTVCNGVTEHLSEDAEITGAFDIEVERRDEFIQRNLEAIVKTLDGIKRPDNFVSARKEIEYLGTDEKRPTSITFANALAPIRDDIRMKYSLKRNVEVDGIECSFRLEPKYNALSMLAGRLLFVPSLSFVATFFRIETLKMTNWNTFVPVGDTSEWRYERTDYNSYDGVSQAVGAFFAEYTKTYIDSVLDMN